MEHLGLSMVWKHLGHQNVFFLPGISEQCSDEERLKTPFSIARFWRQLINSIYSSYVKHAVKIDFDEV